MVKKYLPIFIIPLVIFMLNSCAEDPAKPEDETQDEHVCKHLLEGPAYSITIFTTKATALDAASANSENLLQNRLHTRYDLTLPENNGQYEGWLAYKPIKPEDGDGDFVLYSTKSHDDVQINLYASDSENPISPKQIWDHSEDCELIQYKAVYYLSAAKIYVLHIQSTTEAELSVLLPRFAGEDDHDH